VADSKLGKREGGKLSEIEKDSGRIVRFGNRTSDSGTE
jgi:hypothetical protein